MVLLIFYEKERCSLIKLEVILGKKFCFAAGVFLLDIQSTAVTFQEAGVLCSHGWCAWFYILSSSRSVPLLPVLCPNNGMCKVQ